MKTKPNFTYKQFIQNIATLPLNTKTDTLSKSPKALKTHNKNQPLFYGNNNNNNDQPFFKPSNNKSPNKSPTKTNSPTPKHSPRKFNAKQNILDPNPKPSSKPSTHNNSTNHKKLQLKKPQFNKSQTTTNNKSIKSGTKPNFYHNEPSFIDESHNQSCSTYFKNHFDHDQDYFHNQSITQMNKKSVSKLVKLGSKKNLASSIDGRIKISRKTKGIVNGNGNQTERNNLRVNTQYYEETNGREERMNTQYQRGVSRNSSRSKGGMSPSFYRLSVQESSFLEMEQDKSHKNLFPQSYTSRCKKSTISLTSNQEQKVKINQKSHEHIYNKFISAISQHLFDITRIDHEAKLLEHKIKYIEYLECLKELKMIKADYEPYSQGDGADLVKELWEQLVMGHNINHFIIIVALILKITPLQQIKGQDSQELHNYMYIQNKYEHFRFTRLELDKAKIFSEKDSIQYYNFPFKPTISKNSQELASKTQRKYKINPSPTHNPHQTTNSHNQSANNHNHSDNNHNQSANNHNQSVTSQTKRENMSITNQVDNPIHNSMLRSTSPLGNKRSDILYKQAKKKSLQKRQNKSTVDYEYQKNKQQLTFKPKLIIKRKKHNNHQQNYSNCQYVSPRFAIDEEKTINRLIRGRVEKQIKQKAIDKGLPYNDKVIEKMMREKYEEIIKAHHDSRIKNNPGQNQTLLKSTPAHNQSKGYNDRNPHNESKTHNESKITESKFNLKVSQLHNRSRDDKSIRSHKEQANPQNNRCTTQVQQLENIHNLSFQDYQNQDLITQRPQQQPTSRVQTSPLKSSNFTYPKSELQQEDSIEPQPQDSNPDDFFSLDIYYEEDKCDKLMIRRDSSFEEIVEQTQKFVQKHNLSREMGNKLKQELMIAMKYHDVQKIQENAEEDECSLLG